MNMRSDGDNSDKPVNYNNAVDACDADVGLRMTAMYSEDAFNGVAARCQRGAGEIGPAYENISPTGFLHPIHADCRCVLEPRYALRALNDPEMCKNRWRLGEPQNPLWELTTLPKPPSWLGRGYSLLRLTLSAP